MAADQGGIRVGVLAIQGSVSEHSQLLAKAGARAVEVRIVVITFNLIYL